VLTRAYPLAAITYTDDTAGTGIVTVFRRIRVVNQVTDRSP
jgi:hypothetical protein